MNYIRTAAFALLFLLPVTTQAQEDKKDPKKREEHADKVDKLKIAFITMELNLTTAEAEKFWPIYNELDDKLKELRKSERVIEHEIRDSLETMTNEEAKKNMNALFENQERETALRKEYSEKFSKVLGEKRALKLLSLEHEFRRELLERLRDEHPGPDGPRPPHPQHRPHDKRQ